MQEIKNVIMLTREDLNANSTDKKFSQINLTDLKDDPEIMKIIQNSNLVIFISQDNKLSLNVRIIKNRYGRIGTVK